MDGEPAESGHLLDNLVLFGRLLRDLGFDVSHAQIISSVQAMQFVDIGQKRDFYYALRCLLTRSKDEIPVFDKAFALFWRKPGQTHLAMSRLRGETSDRQDSYAATPTPIMATPSGRTSSTTAGDQDGTSSSRALKTYSDIEILRHKDFAEMTEEEIGTVLQYLAVLIWRLGFRKSRRKQPGKGALTDFRRSLRSNLRYGGEMLLWKRRRPKRRPRTLVILADISGSMEQYTRMLLHFAYFLARGYERSVETFVFSTMLTRITPLLGRGSAEEALEEVSRGVQDWAGGTRIGQSVKDFNFIWGRRLLARGAVVLLISDGWDRGDPVLLQREVYRLQRSCYRLVWLNPLLGSPSYEPLTRGMQAALPHIDDFLPVHNLNSLEDLALHLSHLQHRHAWRHAIPSASKMDAPRWAGSGRHAHA